MEYDFEGPVWEWRGPSPYHFVTVPDECVDGLRALASGVSYGWGMVPVSERVAVDDVVRVRIAVV
ncbi:DUF1905 domain-containing protein [Cryptosporangium phraense]|uniref:DUF1905 domain-containing protein n=1 Tax=Cryptosporangium phraense TaxID=2593070 RepID=A0A545ADU3_9ACTN|nr:DUF1905 domain-containing protein [Cryptosporangium phraense]TQS39508.1 DUF1905 domain-containing protein [Cryptosporangium phraense]